MYIIHNIFTAFNYKCRIKFSVALPHGTMGGVSHIPMRKDECSPTGQPSGWLFLFHNEGGF